MLANLYRLLTDLGSPLIGLYLRRRMALGKEDSDRFGERMGQPSRPRPAGKLVWCHAASMGEAASLLILIEKMRESRPDLSFLMTTGTITAAQMIMPRLPPCAVHQYVPVDRLPYVQSFLNHWRPDFAIWIESELWPNTLGELAARKIPVILLNARMSDRSFRRWHRAKGWARQLMSAFGLCLAQTEDDKGRFIALGARPVRCVGNLKYASNPLPFDEASFNALRKEMIGRPVWLMASTHRGEEELAVEIHKAAAEKRPGLLTVIVPRHAVRGDEIAALLRNAGLKVAQRSAGEALMPDTQVYLADTMGELGLFYRLCPITVLGGSFVWGGHNPIEPAQLGTAIIFGPQMFNFGEIALQFVRCGGALQVKHANEIPFILDRLFDKQLDRENLVQSARLLADEKRGVIDRVLNEMTPWLKAGQS